MWRQTKAFLEMKTMDTTQMSPSLQVSSRWGGRKMSEGRCWKTDWLTGCQPHRRAASHGGNSVLDNS
jgi:hypothetical protein